MSRKRPCEVVACPNEATLCGYHAARSCSRRHVAGMTERQAEAFDAFKMARERIATIKAFFPASPEDSRSRWERLRDAERAFKEAFDELDASIVDAMGES
jgi:hypothetical protein